MEIFKICHFLSIWMCLTVYFKGRVTGWISQSLVHPLECLPCLKKGHAEARNGELSPALPYTWVSWAILCCLTNAPTALTGSWNQNLWEYLDALTATSNFCPLHLVCVPEFICIYCICKVGMLYNSVPLPVSFQLSIQWRHTSSQLVALMSEKSSEAMKLELALISELKNSVSEYRQYQEITHQI